MKRFVDRRSGARRASPTRLRAAWGACVLAALALGAPVDAQVVDPPTPAGTRILNEATVEFTTGAGSTATAGSNSVVVDVGQIAGVGLEPPLNLSGTAGGRVVLAHTLTNLGNGADGFVLSAAPPTGWAAPDVYHDVDGDGALTAADTLVTGPIQLGPGQSFPLLVVQPIPATASLGDATVEITATSTFDGSVSATVTDVVDVLPGARTNRLTVVKQVNPGQAAPGETVQWAVGIVVDSGVPARLVLRDTLPAGVEYVPGTLRLNGSAVTDADDADPVRYVGADRLVELVVEGVEEDAFGLTFETRVGTDVATGTSIENLATGTLAPPAGQSERLSDGATLQIVEPTEGALDVTKRLVAAADSLFRGDSVRWEITVTNTTATPVTDVVARDLVPEGIDAVDASPFWNERSADGDTLTWVLGTLDANASVTLALLGVAENVSAVTVATNTVVASGAGVVADTASSDSVVIYPDGLRPPDGEGPEPSLAIELTTERFEVEPGDRVALRASVLNDGPIVIEDLRVDIGVPEGARFFDQDVLAEFLADGPAPSPGEPLTVPGATAIDLLGLAIESAEVSVLPDSVVLRDDGFSVFAPAGLPPSERFEFSYGVAILTGTEGRLVNTARAEGRAQGQGLEGNVVATTVAQANLVVRRARALETRMIVGRVFVDLDGDGRQGEGEPGVPGAEIWTEDGDVVRTDAFGKYSLVNVRPGRHALRLDPTTLPADATFADDGQAAGVRWVESTAFVTPRADFPLRPVDPNGSDGPGPASDVDAATPGASEGAAAGELRVDPARADSVREAGAGEHFVRGPGVSFFTPVDGFVTASNKAYFGVRGEPGMRATLLRGDEVLGTATLRPDGVHDFLGVDLVPGPQLVRVEMENSWGTVRADTLAVHRSGEVATVAGPERVELASGARTRSQVRLRLLDAWNVPVALRSSVTLEGAGVRIVSADDDPGSVGHQVTADPEGWIAFEVSGSDATGTGSITVSTGEVAHRIDVDVVADVRPLFVNGAAQIGFGAAGEDFGAVTARGALDEETALTISYDSRVLDQDRDAFGRPIDPLSEDQYVLPGDASEQRAEVASRYSFYAKVERGRDWAVFGDIREGWFTDGLGLARYQRAVPGAAARITTGDVVWNAFGARTSQSLLQTQFRGRGTSGPFELGADVLVGTERVAIEARAAENATRIVARDELTRFVDYEIDYESGLIVLKRPLAAADPSGNPLFLVVSYEQDGGGEESTLFGVRGAADLVQLFSSSDDPSAVRLPLAASIVRDDAPGIEYTLGAVNTAFEHESGARLAAEVAMADGVDSTGVATRVEGALPLFDDRFRVTALWGRIDDEFTNPSNAGLQPGVSEFRVGGTLQTEVVDVGLDWEEQDFSSIDRQRSRFAASARRDLTETVDVEVRVSSDRAEQDDRESSTGGAEAELGWDVTDRLRLSAEGREEFGREGLLPSIGSFLGAGATFRLLDEVALEARHRFVRPGGTEDEYQLSSIGVTSQPSDRTRAWGSYQLAGNASGYRNASVLGLNHQFTLGEAWRIQTLLERRDGVGVAAPGDPVLASPFLQEEQDYLALAVGAEYLPTEAPYRVSARAETKDATGSRTNRLGFAGDVALTDDLGLLGRADFAERDRTLTQGVRYSRDRAGLLGLAFRPAGWNSFNVLARFEWRDHINPLGRSLLQGEGEEERIIGAVETMWLAHPALELGARVAWRDTEAREFTDTGVLDRSSEAAFLGGRARLDVLDRVALAVTARGLLTDLDGGDEVWDVFPALIVTPFSGLELETGYHFGDLEDPDFAVRGGEGWYATIGFRFTERLGADVVDFWRERWTDGR